VSDGPFVRPVLENKKDRKTKFISTFIGTEVTDARIFSLKIKNESYRRVKNFPTMMQISCSVRGGGGQFLFQRLLFREPLFRHLRLCVGPNVSCDDEHLRCSPMGSGYSTYVGDR